MTSFKKIIKGYLEKRAQGDAVFAEKFFERCSKEKEAIADCCAYIKTEAKKEAQNGCAVIADDKVFGWAMHYFDEGVRLETIELDTKKWRILQCRGRFNKESAYHKTIVGLMEKNMNKLRQAIA